MAIRLESVHPRPGDDVKIVWKGRRIAKLIFPSGKVVEFDEPVEIVKEDSDSKASEK